MTFQVPASKKSQKQNRFEFEHDGKTLDVPLLKFVTAAAAEAFESGREVTGLILAADKPEVQTALRSMDSDQLEALMSAWGKASKITVGESQGSSDS